MTFKELITNKFSFTDIAVKLNVSKACVSKWSAKKSTPRPQNIKKLAELLNVTQQEVINYFYGEPKEIKL